MSIEGLGAASGANGSSVVHHKHRGSPHPADGEQFTLPSPSDQTSTDRASAQSGDGVDTTDASAPADTLQVNLHNGFTVSATHLGSGAFSAQLLSSMEEMIGYLNGLDTSSGSAPHETSSNTGSTGSSAPTANGGDYRCLDTFHVDLGDEGFLDLHYSTESDGGNKDASAADAMAKAIETLIGKYGKSQPNSLVDFASLYDSVSKPAA